MVTSQFQSQLDEAVLLKKEKNYNDSWELFSELAKSNPHSAYFWSNFAHLAFLMNRHQKAKKFSETALSISPRSRFIRSLYSSILLRTNNTAASLEIIQELIEEKMEIPLLMKLVKVGESLGILTDLEPYFNEWIQRFHNDGEFVSTAAEYYHKIGNTEKAIELYQRVVSEGKSSDFAYERLIALKTEGKSGPEKIRQLEMILKLPSQEKNVHLLGLLAREYKKSKEWENAEQTYRKILAISPDDLFQKKQMGFLYAKRGSLAEAAEILKDCLLKDPDDHFVRSSLFAAFRKMFAESLGDGKEQALQFIDQLLLRYPEKRNYLGIRRKVEKW
ncbi:MAG: tetratricopeptide repeat protein [Candidatus Marinimicrobia bacterium]|nr:tetratricopeptide repeat protein [Candidatus Neomarinimicrobiota bacterium]